MLCHILWGGGSETYMELGRSHAIEKKMTDERLCNLGMDSFTQVLLMRCHSRATLDLELLPILSVYPST